MSDDPKTTRYVGQPRADDIGTRPTARAREAVVLPKPQTLADLDERLAKRHELLFDKIRDDARIREERTNERTDRKLEELRSELLGRVDPLETTVKRTVSSGSMPAMPEAAVLIELKRIQDRLDAQPMSGDVSRDITRAAAGVLVEVRAGIKRWGPIAAVVAGAVAGGSSYVANRGTTQVAAKEAAKEAAVEAVREAPPPPASTTIMLVQPAPNTIPQASGVAPSSAGGSP